MVRSLFSLLSPCTRDKSNPLSSDSQTEVGSTSSVAASKAGDAADMTTSFEHGSEEHCIFCHVSRERGFGVVYEDEQFVVFRDHRPAASHHLLVVPRRHIDSVRTLRKDEAAMVARMAEVGHNVLDELKVPVSSRRLGFHIPPFYSVKHLHLHLLVAPYKSTLMRAKYPVVRGWAGYDKGFSWFVEVDQAIAILEKGGRVKISSC